MSIQIQSLKLPLSDNTEDSFGEKRLRLYQAQLRRCESPAVLLKAPTGSGKTLAYLIRAIGTNGEQTKFGTTIIVYPTNSLIWDQARALSSLIEQLGKTVNVVFERDNAIVEQKENNADVDLFVLNGETLTAIAQESKTSEGTAIIKQLRNHSAKARIFLTNPEILYMLFLFKFNQNENLKQLLLDNQPPHLLIFDEFHLYYGYSLASLSYMLSYIENYFSQIIFSSATPINIESIINKKVTTIVAEPSDNGTIVKHPMNLRLYSAQNILNTVDTHKLKAFIHELYEKNQESTQAVKVLVILNSVITCNKLVEAIKEDYPDLVTPIHGLIPSDERPRDISEFKPIVVGTSAIEVGIDFDACTLIFEAQNSSTFLQRIGRGARHNPCEAIAFIPEIIHPELTKELPNGTTTTHAEFESCIRHILPDLPSYSDFPSSKEATPIMLAILLNWTRQRPSGNRKLNNGQILAETKTQIDKGEFNLPKHLNASKEEFSTLCQQAFKYGIPKMAERLSCRSSMESIPAIFRIKDRSDIKFDYLSINDLPKVDFSIKTREDIEKEKISIPWKMRLTQVFVEVKRIKDNQEKVKVNIAPGRFTETPESLTNFCVIADNQDTADKIEEIIKGQPAFLLDEKEDWRLPGLYTTNSGYLTIGGDAFLAQYIYYNKRNQFDQKYNYVKGTT